MSRLSRTGKLWQWMMVAIFCGMALLGGGKVHASVNDALSFAYEAADPYVKQGFNVREEAWGGDLAAGEKKAIAQQLFRGNEYWFCMATDDDSASISIHIYDSDGNLAEVEDWQRGRFAAARIIPKATGTYYLIVHIKKSKLDRTAWALVYGYR